MQVDTSHGSTSVTSSVTSLFGTSVRPQSSSSEAGSGYHRYTFPDHHQPQQQQPASDEPHLQPPQDLNWAGAVPIRHQLQHRAVYESPRISQCPERDHSRTFVDSSIHNKLKPNLNCNYNILFTSEIILARNVDLMSAPPSGQLVRLRQGKSPSEGYVQMFSNNEWGWVGVTSRLVYCNMSSAL